MGKRNTIALVAALGAAVGACHRSANPTPAERVATAAPAEGVATTAMPPTGAAGAAAASVTPKVGPAREAQALSKAFTTVAKAIRPSVVRLDVEGRADGPLGAPGRPEVPDFLRRFFDFNNDVPAPSTPIRGTGSGVIVDAAGDILTNNHVVHGATKVTIRLADGRTFPGKVAGADPMTDVGVVRFEKAPAGLTAARLGNSDGLEIGEWVLAVGSPLGMEQTVTVGIVSGVGQTGRFFRFESGERVRQYIETDAKINPGNSGGPLVDLEGEVVGINTLINVGPGGSYGFAIPVNQAFEVAKVLMKEGRVHYPYLGITVVSVADATKEQLEAAGPKPPSEGALIGAVSPGGPAARAGLQPADVIVKVAGKPIKSGDDVVARVSEHKIGDTIDVGLIRGGKERTVPVKVGELPGEPALAMGEGPLGITLQTLTAPLASSLGLEPGVKGAVVTDVAPGSPAARAGLAEGDVIREVDHKPVASAEEAAAALKASKGSPLLRVTNGRTTRYVTVGPAS